MRVIRLIRRYICWKRIMLHGFCPECNSSAPELYNCPICKHDTESPFNTNKRKELWSEWKKYHERKVT